MESRVDLYPRIRRDARVDGLSIRELSRRHGVGRGNGPGGGLRAEPLPRKVPERTSPRKQRHTARRILARLAEEHGAVELSYSAVRDYVARRRPVIDAAVGRGREVFVRQEHAPGAEAEVDFGDVWVVLAGVKTKCQLFAFRLSHSGRGVHRVYPTSGLQILTRGPYFRVRDDRRDPDEADQVRQLDRRRDDRGLRHGQMPDGEPQVVLFHSHPLRVRSVLLPPGHRRSPREGRHRG